MRIIAGSRKGLRLAELGAGDEAARLRPTSDRVRESLFNMLWANHRLPGPETRVLDLFAGTGALGLEALSRGAAHAVFVETGRIALKVLRANLARAAMAACAQVIARDATRIGSAKGPPCSLVFLDPPYGQGLGAPALAAAREGGWLADGAIVAWEDAAAQPAPQGFAVLDARSFGKTHITLMQTA